MKRTLSILAAFAVIGIPATVTTQTTPSPWKISTEFAKGEAPVGKINFYPDRPISLPENFGFGTYSFGMGSETDTGTPLYAFDLKWGGHWMLSKSSNLFLDAGFGLSLFYRQSGPFSMDNLAGRGVLYIQVGF